MEVLRLMVTYNNLIPIVRRSSSPTSSDSDSTHHVLLLTSTDALHLMNRLLAQKVPRIIIVLQNTSGQITDFSVYGSLDLNVPAISLLTGDTLARVQLPITRFRVTLN